MPSAEVNSLVTRQPEKPHHYSYLKSFRTEQCKDFLNHRCNQHRPFTCFYWHFPNQRRRRPVLNAKDGTFNYSPEIYCTSFDESTGNCPQGDSCALLHRNIGDTEKRYHLRYYKTERCVIETENKGSCMKNGPHCAFAHGPDDHREPVYDTTEKNITKPNEQQHQQTVELEMNGDRDKTQHIDPVWYDENYIKMHYKTEACTRTVRHITLSCPFYHNARDRRRKPDVYKCRAVVCPAVRHKEDWLEPNECEHGDNCPYIHTRTEQQYHPDIYKTDKCHEEIQNGRCSKGIFCAFAHEHRSLPHASPDRTLSSLNDNDDASIITSQTKQSTSTDLSPGAGRNKNPTNGSSSSGHSMSNGALPPGTNSDLQSNWLAFNSLKMDPRINDAEHQSKLKQYQMGTNDQSMFLDPNRRIIEYRSIYGQQPFSNVIAKPAMSDPRINLYQIGREPNESLFKAPTLSSINKSHLLDRLESHQDENDHSLLSNLPNSGLHSQAVPFNSAPAGFMPSGFNSFPPGNVGVIGQSGLSTTSVLSAGTFNQHPLSVFHPQPPSVGFGLNSSSRLAMHYGLSLQSKPTVVVNEVDKLKMELDEARKVIRHITEQKQQAIKDKNVVLHQHQAESKSCTDVNYLRCLMPTCELEALSVPYLQDLQLQLQLDLRRLQMVISRKAGGKCLACLDQIATTLLPCKHKSLCEPCLVVRKNCPLCGATIPDQQF